MAHRKAGGSVKNLGDSNPKYLGIKLPGGAVAQPGSIIVRQRGSRFRAGRNVSMGKDRTIFSLADGVVRFYRRRRERFDGQKTVSQFVEVVKSAKASQPGA
jgi:large subunit ribosomal protein L27